MANRRWLLVQGESQAVAASTRQSIATQTPLAQSSAELPMANAIVLPSRSPLPRLDYLDANGRERYVAANVAEEPALTGAESRGINRANSSPLLIVVWSSRCPACVAGAYGTRRA